MDSKGFGYKRVWMLKGIDSKGMEKGLESKAFG